jgi:hypothetical protein
LLFARHGRGDRAPGSQVGRVDRAVISPDASERLAHPVHPAGEPDPGPVAFDAFSGSLSKPGRPWLSCRWHCTGVQNTDSLLKPGGKMATLTLQPDTPLHRATALQPAREAAELNRAPAERDRQ